MKKVLKLLIIISFTGLFLTACGGDGTDETNDDSENVTADNETADDEASGTDCPADNKFCHEHNGLNWTAISSEKIVWSKAVEDCQGLGGRLPTIAELRGLIEGCEKTVTGGSCAFTEGCLTNECIADCFCDSNNLWNAHGRREADPPPDAQVLGGDVEQRGHPDDHGRIPAPGIHPAERLPGEHRVFRREHPVQAGIQVASGEDRCSADISPWP